MNEGFTIKETIEILKKHDLKLNKRFGQNFLTDKNILNKIVDSARLNSDDRVLEIGPGIGTLTRALAAEAGKVVAVEIDTRLIPILKETTSNFPNIRLINGDILKVNLKELWNENFSCGNVKVVANLPYYITSPVIMKLLEEEISVQTIVVMVQKEVAQRMIAIPGTKDYGALTIGIGFYARPEIIATVPPTVFVPPPKVSSAIVRLDIGTGQGFEVNDKRLMFSLVKAAFGQRRKTLINSLKGVAGLSDKGDVKEALKCAGIDGNRRGETLSIEEFCRLADCIR